MRSLVMRATVALLGLSLAASSTPAWADAAGQSREAVVDQYRSILLPALDVPNDWSGSVDACTAGTTGTAYQSATLAAINYLRGLAGLAGVSLDAAKSAPAQSAALVMTAQGALSHAPPTDWNCWSSAAYDGASHSNLYLGRAGADAIVGYLADPGSNNALVGHRRWILYSRATSMGTGDTSRANALYVIGAPYREAPAQWTPWPAAGYFPWQLEPAGRWSLSMPGADFRAATVTASAGGAPLAVTVTPPSDGYGDNTLSWQVTLPDQAGSRPTDLDVQVAVSGVGVGGSATDFGYTVSLVDAAPLTAPSEPVGLRATRNRGGILAAWQPGADTGGAAVTYTVTATPVGRGARTARQRTCTATGSACQLTGTKRTVAYRLVLVAANSVGSSGPVRVVSRSVARSAP